MLEPVELKDFFIVFFSGAMVIMAGALYALLFAWSRLQVKPWLMFFAYISYLILFISVLTLASAAHLHGFWWWLVITMLVGYFLAPHGIWKLCVATHAKHEEDQEDQEDEAQYALQSSDPLINKTAKEESV